MTLQFRSILSTLELIWPTTIVHRTELVVFLFVVQPPVSSSRFNAGFQPGVIVKMLIHKRTLEMDMGTLTAADMLTPGQKRAKQQRERDAFIRTKFKIDNNLNPQYFNGTITRGFKMRDGSVYIEFNQYNNPYQIIIAELSATYGYAKQIVEQFEAGLKKLITVKGVSGRVSDKGIRNIKNISFIK